MAQDCWTGVPPVATSGRSFWVAPIFSFGVIFRASGEGGAIDQAELFRGITRYRKLIERTDYLGQVLNQATQALFSSQPGPVLLSIPYNVQKELVDNDVLDQVHVPERVSGSHELPVAELAGIIESAAHPVIIAGYGCRKADARDVVSRLSEAVGIPVATSLKGKGVVAEGSALSLGCLGVTSYGDARRYIVDCSDLVIFLGAGFNERTSYLWDEGLLSGKKIVQVDRDPAQLGRVFRPDLAIHGDIQQVLTELLDALKQRRLRTKSLDALAGHRAAGAPSPVAEAAADAQQPFSKFHLIEAFYVALAKRFPTNAIVFDDNIVFAQRYFDVSDANHYFPNTGISSLGHAIPAAIGARFFASESPTFAILGDGGFQMCCMEIMTAVNYAIPPNVVVINNATMGLIRKNQYQLYEQHYIDCDFVSPDFAWMARSFGISHYRLEQEADIDRLFIDADLEASINLIEIVSDKNPFPTYLSSR